ncbi:unnamed protein product [Lepidochelys kempii]
MRGFAALGICPKVNGLGHLLLRPDAQTVGEIMDELILEQFLWGLPENIQVWVRRHQPNMVEVALKLTEEHVETDFTRRERWQSREVETGRLSRKPPPGKGPKNKQEDSRGTPMGFRLVVSGSADDRDTRRGIARTWIMAGQMLEGRGRGGSCPPLQ